jgi:hypothetical protein
MPLDGEAYKAMLMDLIEKSDFVKEVGDTKIVDLNKSF